MYYICYFIIFFSLIGVISPICRAASETNSINNPALTGELKEQVVSPETHPPVSTATPPKASPEPPTKSQPSTPAVTPESRVASLEPADLKEFADQPQAVQQLLTKGLSLTSLNLKYKYGSDDPKNGGMDCSGTVYYLLDQAGLKDVPRDASEMYKWVWTKSHFQSVVSTSDDTFELNRLKPGDLLFWTGTYSVDRDPPVTHVMIYLGTNRHNGHRVMLGASEGRTYDGKSRYGVSVFDFQIPKANRKSSSSTKAEGELQSRFIGYGAAPSLNKTN